MDKNQADIKGSSISNLVWEFNFRLDNYTHESWLDKMPDGLLIKKLVGKQRSAERIVQHLMQRFGLENQVFFNFSNSLTRLALWSGEDLEKLMIYSGSIFFYPKIQRIVMREEVEKQRKILGEELFRFMQRRATLVRGKMELPLSLPDNLSEQQWLMAAGYLCLMSALQDYPLALRKRIMLKLPYEWYVLYQRLRSEAGSLWGQQKECSALIQKVAIEIRMGVGTDGQIRLN